ncbi:MAG TPA: hypothetical protein VJY34_21390 [Roseiarcus sp.]|nr:hypothetical protein [Roseiarcus sp.]
MRRHQPGANVLVGLRIIPYCKLDNERLQSRKHIRPLLRPHVGQLIAMTIEANSSGGPSDRGKLDPAASFSWPDPQEGSRLMRAFLSIRQAALRDAIVKIVTQLSTLDDEGQ